MSYWYPRAYVPVARRREKAEKQVKRRLKKGQPPEPVEIEGKTIAHSFWGKGWCAHLETFSDYDNRLPRGRTYVRNGSVCHLAIEAGRVEALVSGSSLYSVTIDIKPLNAGTWKDIQKRCSGQIGSMIELLQGSLSNEVMAVVSDPVHGLFPEPEEIDMSCSCPDWAVMCKHVAAVLYGVGNRLDTRPELLFRLRDVDAEALIATEFVLPGADGVTGDALADDQLHGIFGLDMDMGDIAGPSPPPPAERRQSRKQRNTGSRPRVRRAPEKTQPRLRPTGKSVARLRKKLGMTVEEFAFRVGVSKAAVYRWESTDGPLNLQRYSLRGLGELHLQAKSR